MSSRKMVYQKKVENKQCIFNEINLDSEKKKNGDETECLHRENWENLGNAIIQQACNDYVKKLRKEGYDCSECVLIRKFFHSQFYKSITKVDGDYILKKLESKQHQKKAIVTR